MPDLPEQFLNSLEALPHFNRQKFVAAHAEGERPTSVRLNPFKPVQLDFALGPEVPWCSRGFYLPERPSFTLDPLFHAGCYYVQEAGSMFLEHAMQIVKTAGDGERVLDLCGAPGGKSTLLNSVFGQTNLLVSNEVIRSRVPSLVQNLSKWGTCNTIVTNCDPAKFAVNGPFFDLIVVDAPCSGSGLFRKQPEAIAGWSEQNVLMCSRRQKQILADILPALEAGGWLFYSTCSFSRQENEDIVQWLCAENGMQFVEIPVREEWNIVSGDLGYRFYPDKTSSEGFFCALMRKPGSSVAPRSPRKNTGTLPEKADLALLEDLFAGDAGTFVKLPGGYHYLNEKCRDFVLQYGNHLYFKKAGHFAGNVKGRDLVPSHEAAMSIHLSDAVQKVGLELPEAISFLRKTAFSLPQDKKGFHLMTYKGMGLGWAKLLPGRMNNYLPNELRVLM